MNGLKIKVKTVDGSTDEVFTITPRMHVETEQKFGKGWSALFGLDARFETVYFLAWLALRTNGKGPKPFGLEFIETLEDVEIVEDPFTESTQTP